MLAADQQPAPGSGRELTDTGTQRIYILPTGFGLVYAVLVGGMLLGSLNYNNNLGLLLSFLLIGQGLVAMIHTWRNLRGLRLSPRRAPSIFAGGVASFPLQVAAADCRRHLGILIETQGSGAFLDLGPGQDTEIRLSVQAHRRGQLVLGRLRVSTRFPLGLFRAWSDLDPGGHCLVYPRPTARGSPQAFADGHNDRAGGHGQGAEDFVGLRSYRAGDSPRQIDWKALARERGLLAKQFTGSRSEQLWVDWDSCPGLPTEARLSRLCRGVLDADAGISEYGLRMPGSLIPPARGVVHQSRCLAALARFGEPP